MLTAPELAQLRSYLATLNPVPGYEEVSATLNAPGPDVPNPVAQTKVPKPVDMGELFYLLKGANDAKVMMGVTELVKAGSELAKATGTTYAPSLSGLLELMRQRGLTNESYEAIKTRIGETMDDPAWVPTVPGRPVRESWGIFSEVSPEDVQTVELGLDLEPTATVEVFHVSI